MSTQRACDVCHMFRQRADGSVSVRRYTLRREDDQTRSNGLRLNRKQVSAGGIDLCHECWEKIAAPNLNPKKSHPRPDLQGSRERVEP